MARVSIQIKIVSLIVVVLVLVLFSVLAFSISNQRRNLIAATDRTLEIVTEVILQSFQTIMLIGETPVAVETQDNLKEIEELEDIDIFKVNGERAFSDYETLEFVNNYQEEMVFDRTMRLEHKTISNDFFVKAIENVSPVMAEMENPYRVEYYFPLINTPDCQDCHGDDHNIRGILHFKISVEEVNRQIKKASIVLIVIFVVAGILTGGGLILILKRIVIRPLMMLGRTLQAVTFGSFKVRVDYESNDELGEIAAQTNSMITGLKERTDELQLTQDATILSLASLAETRDNETGSHILRTQHYVRLLAEELSLNERFSKELTDELIQLLYMSAPLHDIGKVGVPDAILLKPGKLIPAEWEVMKKHPHYGYEALRVAEERLGSTSFLQHARQIALRHHEKWDGSGYPDGIAGEEIPLAGRLMAIADVYDALISKRVYKEAFSHEKAVDIIKEGSGVHFDPVLVDVFLKKEKEVMAIAAKYRGE
jgi:response regulator RpfG family c-di-GMP phosphodiesterase